MSAALMMAAAAPATLGTIVVLAFAGAESAGRAPLSIVPVNIAEAAAMGNAAETVRFLQEGRDPSRVADVRSEIISSEITRVNAYEASIWSRQVGLVELLDRRKALAPAARAELACLAADLRDEDIVEYLSAGSALACDPDAARRRVMRRSVEADAP